MNMAKANVLVLYNQPLLPADHPDYDSEFTIIEIAQKIERVLEDAGYRTSMVAMNDDPIALWQTLQQRKPEAVFNLFEGSLHHAESESYVAGLLEWAGLPYTGSPAPTLSLARAKHTAKILLRGAGLPTADFCVVPCLPAPPCPLDWPVIVKPARMDASVGLAQESVCTDQGQLEQRVAYILETYGAPVLVEEYIPGREFHVALLELPELEYLPACEIVFPAERPGYWPILTYNGKWKPGTAEYDTTPPTFPADIPPALRRELGNLAMEAHRLFGCRDYARVDFRLRSDGKPFILEVNPNPEISEDAGFAGCLGSAAVVHDVFIVRLIEQALRRRAEPRPTFAPTRPYSGAH
jgi:D-alanine-D-alanine ligase